MKSFRVLSSTVSITGLLVLVCLWSRPAKAQVLNAAAQPSPSTLSMFAGSWKIDTKPGETDEDGNTIARMYVRFTGTTVFAVYEVGTSGKSAYTRGGFHFTSADTFAWNKAEGDFAFKIINHDKMIWTRPNKLKWTLTRCASEDCSVNSAGNAPSNVPALNSSSAASYSVALTEDGTVFTGRLLGQGQGRQLSASELNNYLLVGLNRPKDFSLVLCPTGYRITDATNSGKRIAYDPDMGFGITVTPSKRTKTIVTCAKK